MTVLLRQYLLIFLSIYTSIDAFTPPITRSVHGIFRCGQDRLQSTTTEEAQRTTDTNSALEPTDTYSAGDQTTIPEIKVPPSPGFDENDMFECDESVKFWSGFQCEGFSSAAENLRSLSNVASNFASLGPEGMSYWLRHIGRSTYFATNAILGNVGYLLHERLVNGRSTTFTGSLPFNVDSAVASRLLLEAALCFQQDYQQIQRGAYRKPWDMKLNHRQSSPINIVTQTGRFVQEAIGTLGRRTRGEQRDKDIWITDESSPGLYPAYYRNAFHYQTDGWMSKRSADVYDTSTETLFLGRQDAMQRTSLKPLVDMAREAKEKKLVNGRPMKVLEIACGTGRFMTFVRDNLPLDTEYTAVDLSPFYLDAARDNDQYWRKTRKAEEERMNNNQNVEIPPARFVQAQTESLPFDDESFDAVLCVYLFHELPRNARERAAAEMARVVRPGGMVVLTDSIQRGDRPILDERMAVFEKMNEPYYVDYSEDFLPAHFERAGLQTKAKTVRSSTKSLSFTKP